MSRTIFFLMISAMVLGPSGFAEDAPPMSPEQFYLNQTSAEKFGELRKEAKGSFQGILLYPDEIRNAVLVISQYPDLVALIKHKKVLNEAEFEKLLKAQPAEAQDAVQKLKAYPEVIGILDENMTVTSLLGEMVKDKGDEVIQVVKRLSDSVQQGHTKVVTAWTDQLKKDPQAIQQLQAASEAYAKQKNLSSPNQPQTAAQAAASPNPYGYYVNETNTVVIQDMPSDDMMQYMLLNQAMYTMLFTAAVTSHSMFYNDYYWHYYDDHWQDNWNEYQDNLNKIGNGLDDLNQNIDDIQNNWQDRKDDRQDKKDEWQDKKDDWKDRKDNGGPVAEKVQEKRDGLQNNERINDFKANRDAGNLKPSQLDANAIQQARASGFSGSRPNVSFERPSAQQQISRASQYHSGSWSGGGGGGRSFSGGGGGSRGGGSFSGGGGGRRR